jgi:hypothetical protein
MGVLCPPPIYILPPTIDRINISSNRSHTIAILSKRFYNQITVNLNLNLNHG